MDNSNDSPSIKLVSTCTRCGSPVGSSQHSSKNLLCDKCQAEDALDEEDDRDDEPVIIRMPPKNEEAVKGETESASKEELTDADVPDTYEILEALHECQHGKAYLVRDTNLDAKLVIRFVKIGVARLTGGLPIETVAQLLVQQNHPHLATVYDWRTSANGNWMILDAPAERNLETIIKTEGFLDLPRAIDIFIQVCEGLEELHKAGIVHGYVRPRSIGIVESPTKIDTVKITNFSITNVCSNNVEQPLKVSRNYTCNDMFYMSPEDLHDMTPSVSSDLYSLGCVIFHSITGKPVYRARTNDEVREQHLDPNPAKFRRRYEIPANVEQVVVRMLEHNPRNRYKSARAIRRDLERLRDNKPPLLEDRWKTFLSYLGQ